MCGRYSFVPTKAQLEKDLGTVEKPAALLFRYNIAPTDQAYVITDDEPERLQPMEWGLVPAWSKDGVNQGRLINARAETAAEKPSFRNAFRRRHCLTPADSFYEWQTDAAKHKIPYRILRNDGRLLFFAGLWEEWRSGDQVRRTFTILTTDPSPDVLPLHDRMPVILATPEDCRLWLETHDPAEAGELLHAPREGLLRWYRVSEKLNRAGTEGADLHEEIHLDAADGQGTFF